MVRGVVVGRLSWGFRLFFVVFIDLWVEEFLEYLYVCNDISLMWLFVVV